ncbi:MAG: prepilin peptidase [Puniceicoccaceae bacterium]
MSDVSQVLETFPWLGWIFSFVFGAVVGSFLNVCIHRIPEGRSIVYPGSRCVCGSPIPWYDNLPIVSWFVLRGRARCCGRRFGFRYPFVEILTASLFLLSWITHSVPEALCLWVFFALLVPAVFIDLDHFIIPDRFSVGGMFAGVFLSALVPELHGFANPGGIAVFSGLGAAVVGALVGSAVVYWFGAIAEIVFRKEALGQGDVKLAGCFGAFCGWEGAVFSLFGGALIGTVLLLPVLVWQRFFSDGPGGAARPPEAPPAARAGGECPPEGDGPAEDEDVSIGFGTAVPFGPMLCAAIALYVFWLEEVVRGWFAEAGDLLRAIL